MPALMPEGGRTPEELETLLEDACIARNVEGLLALFDRAGVLVAADTEHPARGGEQIAQAAAAIWRQQPTYVASPQRVVQAHDIALSVGGGINVLRRGPDGAWRFAIAWLHLDRPPTGGGNHD